MAVWCLSLIPSQDHALASCPTETQSLPRTLEEAYMGSSPLRSWSMSTSFMLEVGRQVYTIVAREGRCWQTVDCVCVCACHCLRSLQGKYVRCVCVCVCACVHVCVCACVRVCVCIYMSLFMIIDVRVRACVRRRLRSLQGMHM